MASTLFPCLCWLSLVLNSQLPAPQVPEEAGPQDGDLSSVHFPYYSTVDYVTNQYSGLIGVVMITPPATLTAQGALQLGFTAANAVIAHVYHMHYLHASDAGHDSVCMCPCHA